MAAQPQPTMTVEEYLAFERASETKHEYYAGEIFAMVGASRGHNLITTNVIGELRNTLRRRSCEVYGGDMRVEISASGLYTYPDVTVICGDVQSEPADENTALNPTLIVEVLSSSTEEYDRGRKFEHYQQAKSLREYVLVSHREKLIEVFRKNGDAWQRFEARAGATATMQSIDCQVSVDEIYEDVALA